MYHLGVLNIFMPRCIICFLNVLLKFCLVIVCKLKKLNFNNLTITVPLGFKVFDWVDYF